MLNDQPDYVRHGVAFLARYTGQTYQNYRYHLDCWIQWCLRAGLDPLHDVQRVHVELYIRELIEAGYATGTVHCRLAPVRGFYDMAVYDDLIFKDPTRGSRLPKITAKRKQPFDRDDLRQLMAAAREISPRHHALVVMLSMLGMRISEACSIDVPDIYNQEGGYRVLRFVGKGNKPAAMAIPYQAIPVLEAQAGDRRDGPLLTTLDGRRCHRHTAASLVKVAAKRAGFAPDRVHPHLLRAAAITLLMDSGVGLREAQDFARHEDPRTTRKHYDLNRNDYGTQATHLLGARLAV
ncbi:tyrosine-type recombinase/integrase [Nocardioides sp. BP30]|uniref:tyrosine-type recombinase/integrase n=1 Tax=Nocardioides sp. BP30 TaxID=3036374 RepID=UPI0024688300|nr:tyrosine-type recombinase/integrase [Nocardioides sp. BP30]WGL50626.1 tyrosine-type recombinase/integrase [Nocardioides sp. BP30]